LKKNKISKNWINKQRRDIYVRQSKMEGYRSRAVYKLQEIDKNFKNIETSFLYPLLLTFLNAPSILYDIFPFIFLISTQFFFIQIFDKNELSIYKSFGLDNFKILKILASTSLF